MYHIEKNDVFVCCFFIFREDAVIIGPQFHVPVNQRQTIKATRRKYEWKTTKMSLINFTKIMQNAHPCWKRCFLTKQIAHEFRVETDRKKYENWNKKIVFVTIKMEFTHPKNQKYTVICVRLFVSTAAFYTATIKTLTILCVMGARCKRALEWIKYEWKRVWYVTLIMTDFGLETM